MVPTSDLLSWKTRRYIFLIVFLLLTGQLPGFPASVLAAGPPPQEAPSDLEAVTLQLRWFHQFQFAGYYAAEAQGYYRDAGLKVNIVEGDPAAIVNTYEEVLAGRAQYGASNTEVLLRRMAGQPLVVLAAIFQHSPYVMVTPRSSGITNPQDLVGRRINMLLGPRTAEMQAVLISEGIPLEKVTIVSTPGEFPDYLFDDSFDAFGAYETNEPFYLEQAGIPLTFIRPRTYGIDFYGDVLYTSEAELAAHPDRVRRFREASLKGWQYAMEHPDEIIDLILTEYGSPKTRAHLQYEAEQMRQLILPDLVELGHMNPGRWQHIAETYVDLGLASPDYTLDGFIYNPQPEPDNSRFYVALGIIGGLLLLAGLTALILWIFNRRLRAAVAQRTRDLEQSQAALQHSEERYRAVWDIAADAMALSNPDGLVIDANPAYLALYGYTTPEVIGHSFAIIFPEEQRDWAVEQYKATFANPQMPPRFESQIRRSDGAMRTVETRISFIESNGQRRLMLSSIRDITPRKQAEAALAESEEKHRLLFENAGAGIGYYTPEGQIIALNKLASEHLAGQPEDFAGKHIREVFGEAGAAYQERIAQTAASDAVWTQEDCVVLPIGVRWFLSQYARITNEAGQVTGVQIISHDITGRKQAEATLREQEHFNRTIADTAPTLLYIYSFAEKRNIWVNATYNKILQIENADQMPEQEVFDRVHPDDMARLNQQLNRLLREESDMGWEEVELRFKAGDSTWVWLFLRTTAFKRDEAGNITQILGAAIDITDRKNAELALRRYERMVWASPDFLSMIDRDYVYRIVNETYAERAGKSYYELVGYPVADLMGEEVFHALVKPELDRCLAGETVRYQHWFDFPDGERGFMDVTYFPFREEDGTISGVVVSNRDITELKLAQTALAESERNLRALIDATDESVLLIEPDGTIVICNEGVARRFGRARDDLLGTNVYDLVDEAVAAGRRAYADQVIAGGQPVRFVDERFGRTIDNSIYPVLDEAGQVVRLAVYARDITKQVRAEAARRESEAKNRALLEAIPDLMFRLTRDGRVIDFRANQTEDLLLAPEQVIGSRLCDTMPPDVCQLIMAHIERAFTTGRMQIFEYKLAVQQGVQDFEARLTAMGEGNVLAIVRNITALKQAQQSLEDSETNLRALIENTDGVIWAVDYDYRLVAGNSLFYNNMRAAFGSELRPGDRLVKDDFPADAVAQWRVYYDRALRGERFSVEHETRYLAFKQYFEYWFSPIRTTKGELIGVTIYGRDITARKQAEEALITSEERYRHLFEDAQDAIMITDDDQRFVEVNPAAVALLGYAPEELLDMGPPDIVPEATRHLGQSLRQTGRQAGEFTLQRKDGSLVETEYRAVADFLPGLNMVFFRDISARKEYERNLKTALAEKETLLQELYHRTKNNMQVISSMLTLQMGYTEDKLVKRIFEETSNKIRAMAMVHEKLYQSQNLSSIDLKEYIIDLVALLVQSYGERAYGVEISLDLANVPVLIDTATPCGLLLNELISNAFKHAFSEERPGTLKIWLRKLADGTIVLGVSDNGVGFPSDFDVENDGRLGLTLISTLAERQLGGDVTFEGDNGVRFEVRFQDTQYKARV